METTSEITRKAGAILSCVDVPLRVSYRVVSIKQS